MYMFVEDPVSGSMVKLAGEVRLCENTGEVIKACPVRPGQIVTTFKNTPDLPFEDVELHFFGGERAPLTTPSRCGTYTTQASFTPWDGNAPVNTSSTFQITSGPNGGPCPGASLPFAPYADGGHDEHPGGRVQPVHDDDEPRRRPAEPAGDLAAHARRACRGCSSGVKLCGEAAGRTRGRAARKA